MFCVNCGKQLPDNALFCNKCGHRVITASKSEKSAAPEKKQPAEQQANVGSAAHSSSVEANRSTASARPHHSTEQHPHTAPHREITDRERTEREKRRAAIRKKKHRKRIITAAIIGTVVLCVIGAAVLFGDKLWGNSTQDKQTVLKEQVYNTAAFSDPEENSPSIGSKIRSELAEIASVDVISENDESHQIEVTAPDMGALLSDLAQQYDDSALIMEKAYEQLSSGDYQTITRTVEVPLDENSNYAITFELLDALYGGLISEAERILAERGIY